MSQLAPDDRVIHSRYQELGALASVLFSIAPQRLVFFRVDAQGQVAVQGAPVRVFWHTPGEYAAMHDSEFARAVRLRGEDVVLPPFAEPADPGSCEGGSCGLCGPGGRPCS